MIIQTVIVEDELASSRRLQRLLKSFNCEVIASLVSVKSAIQWFKNNEAPDLLFLDVHLTDGLCFEIFKHIEIKTPIVFTTAYSQYSIEAFNYNSISYLLKPIDDKDLGKAIKKAKSFYTNERELLALKELIETERLKSYKTQFAVKIGQKIKFIKTNDISWFYSEANATYLKNKNSNYIISEALISLEELLDPKQFCRINRKYIVNRNAIKEALKYSNNRLKIELVNYDAEEVIVSRNRAKQFKIWLNS